MDYFKEYLGVSANTYAVITLGVFAIRHPLGIIFYNLDQPGKDTTFTDKKIDKLVYAMIWWKSKNHRFTWFARFLNFLLVLGVTLLVTAISFYVGQYWF